MATHSSILAWRIPWTEEPGGLQSTGSQRVGHDWATSLSLSKKTRDSFPGGSVVKKPPANAGDVSLIRGWSHVPWALRPVCHDYWACALEPGGHKEWNSDALGHLKTREATAVRRQCTTAREYLPPTTTRAKPAQQWRPSMGKNK